MSQNVKVCFIIIYMATISVPGVAGTVATPTCVPFNTKTLFWKDWDGQLQCYDYKNVPKNISSLVNSTDILSLRLSKRGNQLEILTNGELERANLLNLEELYMDDCNISKIEKGAFRGGIKIKELTLGDNGIKSLDLEVFSDLPNLEELWLDGNPIKEFGKDFKSEFPLQLNKLKRLELTNCNVTFIRWNLFKNLVNLEKLILTGNPITVLSGESSSFFGRIPPSLHKLYLNKCRINQIEKGAFAGGENLRILFLSSNKLNENLDLDVFSALSQLELLFLENNPFTKFKENAQFPKLNITRLNLNNCSLHHISDNLFTNLQKLSVLELEDNLLKTFSENVIQPLISLKWIDLRSNPWHCDCQVKKVLDFLTKKGIGMDGIAFKYWDTKMTSVFVRRYPECATSSYSEIVGLSWKDLTTDYKIKLCNSPKLTTLATKVTNPSIFRFSTILFISVATVILLICFAIGVYVRKIRGDGEIYGTCSKFKRILSWNFKGTDLVVLRRNERRLPSITSISMQSLVSDSMEYPIT